MGPGHRSVGIWLNNLALLFAGPGRYAEAGQLYRRTLAIAENVLGPDHPNVGTSLNNLASLYEYQGRYAQAEPLSGARSPSPRRRWAPTTPLSASGSTTWRRCTPYSAIGRVPRCRPDPDGKEKR
jgi:hypothetical protein